jgi:hypothetical protein
MLRTLLLRLVAQKSYYFNDKPKRGKITEIDGISPYCVSHKCMLLFGPVKAAILVGSIGTRISEETHLRTKPMIEIGIFSNFIGTTVSMSL